MRGSGKGKKGREGRKREGRGTGEWRRRRGR